MKEFETCNLEVEEQVSFQQKLDYVTLEYNNYRNRRLYIENITSIDMNNKCDE
jgi:hypothetical protein